mmetsp:Transcript_74858/g.216403  ORF Transcript_74858/g.216403 Transcript_74858/m.216403 type:complete len:307 (-) Transcript_74858:468-1388(-)
MGLGHLLFLMARRRTPPVVCAGDVEADSASCFSAFGALVSASAAGSSADDWGSALPATSPVLSWRSKPPSASRATPAGASSTPPVPPVSSADPARALPAPLQPSLSVSAKPTAGLSFAACASALGPTRLAAAALPAAMLLSARGVSLAAASSERSPPLPPLPSQRSGCACVSAAPLPGAWDSLALSAAAKPLRASLTAPDARKDLNSLLAERNLSAASMINGSTRRLNTSSPANNHREKATGVNNLMKDPTTGNMESQLHKVARTQKANFLGYCSSASRARSLDVSKAAKHHKATVIRLLSVETAL